MTDDPLVLTDEERADIERAADWAVENGYIKTRREWDAFMADREAAALRRLAERRRRDAVAAEQQAKTSAANRRIEEREGDRGHNRRFLNRFDVATTRMAANLADVFGFDEKARDVREVADQTERQFAPAETPQAKAASLLGYVGPHALGTIAGGTALNAAANSSRVAAASPRLAEALKWLSGGKNANILRQNIGGEVATAPLTTLPGAFSDDPNQSITGTVSPDSWKITRAIGDMGLGIVGGSALQAGGRGVISAARAGGRLASRMVIPDIGEGVLEAGMEGVRATERASRPRYRGADQGDLPVYPEGYSAVTYGPEPGPGGRTIPVDEFGDPEFFSGASRRRTTPRPSGVAEGSFPEGFQSGPEVEPVPIERLRFSQEEGTRRLPRDLFDTFPEGAGAGELDLEPPVPVPGSRRRPAPPASPDGYPEGFQTPSISTRRRPGNRLGAANQSVINMLGGGMAGGALGGILDDEDPMMGAAFGAGIGAATPMLMRQASRLGRSVPTTPDLPANEALKAMADVPRPSSSDFMVKEFGARPSKEVARNLGVSAGMAGASQLTDDEDSEAALLAGAGFVGGPRGLMKATHNVGARDVLAMLRRGWEGIPSPSVALSGLDIPNLRFGGPEKVSLFGGPELADTKTQLITGGDQWTPMFPASAIHQNPQTIRAGIFNPTVERALAANGMAPWRARLSALADEIAESGADEAGDLAFAYDRLFGELARRDPNAARALVRQHGAESLDDLVQRTLIEASENSGFEGVRVGDEVLPFTAENASRAKFSFGDPRGQSGAQSDNASFRERAVIFPTGVLGARAMPYMQSEDELRTFLRNQVRREPEVLSSRKRREDEFFRADKALGLNLEREQYGPDVAKELRAIRGGVHRITGTEALADAAEPVPGRFATHDEFLDQLRRRLGIEGAVNPQGLIDQAGPMVDRLYDAYTNLNSGKHAFAENFSPGTVPWESWRGALLHESVPSSVEGALSSRGIQTSRYAGHLPDNARGPIPVETEQSWMDAFTGLRERMDKLGRPIAFGAAATALPSVAEAQDGSEDGGMSPLDIALTIAAAGAGGRMLYKNRGALRGMLGGAMSPDLTNVVEEAAKRGARTESLERVAVREANAGERVKKPISPYPDDAFDPVTDVQELLKNPARILRDAGGYQESKEAAERLIQSGAIAPTGKIPWELEKEAADILAVSPSNLATRDAKRKLSGPELLALRNQFTRDSRRQAEVSRILNDPLTPEQDRRVAEQLYDALESRITTQYNRLTRDISQTGRDMNLLKIAARFSDDPRDWWLRAKKLAGDHEVPGDVKADLLRAIERQDWVSASMALNRARHVTWWDKGGEMFQTSLLASIARPIRDILSNTAALADRTVQGQVARGIDRIASSITGTTNYDAPASASIKAAIRGAREGAAMAASILTGSGDPAILERAARRYDFSNETSFRNPLMRAFGRVVRRSIAAVDAISYEGSFALSLEHQAYAMAKNKGVPEASRAAWVEGMLADPPADMILRAVEDATETVWQNKTPLGEFSNKLRSLTSPPARFGGKLLVPFSQTPSAMATEAIRRSPVGTVNTVKELVALMRAKGAEVPEAQRRLVKRIAEQSTGAAWIYAGYYLASKGEMTGAYPTDPNEQARWKEEGKTENSVLSRGRWVGLSGLLGPQAMLMSIGVFMHDLAKEDGLSAADVATASAAGTANTLLDSPMMQGVDALTTGLGAARSGDQQRISDAKDQLGQSFVGGWVPRIIQQLAAGMDTNEQGQTIMRDPAAEGGLLPFIQQGIPGLRDDLPGKVSPFGRQRVTGGSGLAGAVMSPFRTSPDFSSPLTTALGEIGYFPTSPGRTSAEAQARGPAEQQILQGIMDGDPAAWEMVSQGAVEEYQRTGDASEIFRSAIRTYRTRLSRNDRTNP